LFEHDLIRPCFARRSGLREGGKPLRISGIMLQRAFEEASPVIPGRAESANPEFSSIEFLRISGFRIATSWRPE
jgi:hypothetical protein